MTMVLIMLGMVTHVWSSLKKSCGCWGILGETACCGACGDGSRHSHLRRAAHDGTADTHAATNDAANGAVHAAAHARAAAYGVATTGAAAHRVGGYTAGDAAHGVAATGAAAHPRRPIGYAAAAHAAGHAAHGVAGTGAAAHPRRPIGYAAAAHAAYNSHTPGGDAAS